MIRRDDFTPLYIQFYGLLKEELVHFPIGSNIPPERALCEKHGLDRVTVRKALAMLAEEGYIERKQGRGTRVLQHEPRQVGNVLFILCQSTHMADRLGEPIYARSLDLLEEQFQKIGKRLLYSKLFPADSLVDLCKRFDAQAVIIAGTPDEAILKQCDTLNLPLMGYNTRVADYPSVMVDNDGAAALSAQHLLQLGHRRIGFIHVPGHINSEKRLSRFQTEIRSAGMDADDLVIAESCNWREDSGYQAARQLLEGPGPRVTAIFGGNDSMTIGALRAAQDMGLSVPEDLSLIGFDGIAQSSVTVPPLTTSRSNLRAMAEATCMLLNHAVSFGLSSGVHVMISNEFLVRGSTAAPKR